MPRSSFAPSPYSQRPNSASFGFGTATREQAAKVFITQELSLGKQFGVGSPGPAYGVSLPKAVGVQPDARKGAPARILLALLQPRLVPMRPRLCRFPIQTFLLST